MRFSPFVRVDRRVVRPRANAVPTRLAIVAVLVAAIGACLAARATQPTAPGRAGPLREAIHGPASKSRPWLVRTLEARAVRVVWGSRTIPRRNSAQRRGAVTVAEGCACPVPPCRVSALPRPHPCVAPPLTSLRVSRPPPAA